MARYPDPNPSISEIVRLEIRREDIETIKQLRMEAAGEDLIKRWVIEAGLDKPRKTV